MSRFPFSVTALMSMVVWGILYALWHMSSPLAMMTSLGELLRSRRTWVAMRSGVSASALVFAVSTSMFTLLRLFDLSLFLANQSRTTSRVVLSASVYQYLRVVRLSPCAVRVRSSNNEGVSSALPGWFDDGYESPQSHALLAPSDAKIGDSCYDAGQDKHDSL